MGYNLIDVNSISGALGAEVSGVDLAQPLSDVVFGEIQRAFLDYAVICFRDQELTQQAQLDFARRLGTPDVHPIAVGMDDFPEVIRVLKPAGESASFGTSWHSDNSFFEEPSQLTILYGAATSFPPSAGTRFGRRWSGPTTHSPRP